MKGKMMEKINFNPIVPLLLFGIYFIIDYLNTKNILNLFYGIMTIVYSIRLKVVRDN